MQVPNKEKKREIESVFFFFLIKCNVLEQMLHCFIDCILTSCLQRDRKGEKSLPNQGTPNRSRRRN